MFCVIHSVNEKVILITQLPNVRMSNLKIGWN